MTIMRYDLSVRNNTDWKRSFILYDQPGTTPPWENVQPWEANTIYQSISPASVVSVLNEPFIDLYVADHAGAASWVSANTFPSDAANWINIGSGAAYNAAPFNLTGAVLKLAICKLTASGEAVGAPLIAVPRQFVFQMTSDGSEPSIFISGSPAAGNITINEPKAFAQTVDAGVYGFDLNIYQGGAVIPAMYGFFTVYQGANA